ncbi:hypothetical protein AeMF1_019263 [Aphanomyces euteiches]|nr:hypothetical protein AeMF1_019263 [Aphanomyces euteiches]KAH9188589.1 hypothetical protein AeNC1_009436 [Aphanomyces euteiches]
MMHRSAIFGASIKGQLEIAKELLNYRASVFKIDEYGRTALFCALSNGHLKIAELISTVDTSINWTDEAGRTPLLNASANGHQEIVEMLLKSGYAVNQSDKAYQHGSSKLYVLRSGWTPIIATSLNRSFDTFFIVKELLAHGASVNIAIDSALHPTLSTRTSITYWRDFMGEGDTLLHGASINGDIELLETLLDAGADVSLKNKAGRTARDIGRNSVKKFFDTYQVKEAPLAQFKSVLPSSPKVYSIKSAIELIRKAMEDPKLTEFDVVTPAMRIFTLSLEAQIYQESILATALMVEKIVRYVLSNESTAARAPQLPQVLNSLEEYLGITLLTTHPSKLLINDVGVKGRLKMIASDISKLRNDLETATEMFHLSLDVEVIGDDLGNVMEKISDMDQHLKSIVNKPQLEQQTKSLAELMIQLQRGMDHYALQVAVGNMTLDNSLEMKMKDSQAEVWNTFDVIRQMQVVPKSFSLDKIEQWMMSSDDLIFDSNDENSILGIGGFGKVVRGTYRGNHVAIKLFPGVMLTDSADFEKAVAKEIKAWKAISHEPHILTLHLL